MSASANADDGYKPWGVWDVHCSPESATNWMQVVMEAGLELTPDRSPLEEYREASRSGLLADLGIPPCSEEDERRLAKDRAFPCDYRGAAVPITERNRSEIMLCIMMTNYDAPREARDQLIDRLITALSRAGATEINSF